MPKPVVAPAARVASQRRPRLLRAGLLALALKATFLATSRAFTGGGVVQQQQRPSLFGANNNRTGGMTSRVPSTMPGTTVVAGFGARSGAARKHRPGTWKCGCEACVSFESTDDGKAQLALLEKHYRQNHDMSVALPSMILPERSLRMRQSIPCSDCLMSGDEGPGGAVSAAGMALATYINNHAPPGHQSKEMLAPWRGINVLELGSGTGVAGIAAASEGATVLLTDKDVFMPLMAKNIRLNEDNIMTGSADYEAFDWAAPPPEEVLSKTWDVVLCAESVTRSSDVPLFVSALASLLGPDGAAASATAIYAHNPMDSQSPELHMQLKSEFEARGLSYASLPSPPSQSTGELSFETVELW
eukprot:CAMPEP_0172684424 /NCGR_PEP_ID=MMETSP1074-20121228/19550_1 /TAXON_ID=2916 /ORGANISM="Ceratium fusus, Strain PA161109" /LENGTH=358 /DNA_ID=CAMNT_0013503435 /DNA_START=76 /DNA_END=1149 /DNA_ORIENTATION=-